MANPNSTVIVGNLVRDPELKYLASGQAVAHLTVATSRKWQNKQTQEWQEQTGFFDVVAWGQTGEHVAESLSKGDRVIVAGRLDQRSWETPEGDKRSKIEINADSVGVDLSYATAQVTRIQRETVGERSVADGAEDLGQPF